MINTAPLFAFMRKRHEIFIKRSSGAPYPWTDDPILRQYRFTNVYRELDATTVWFREKVRDLYDERESVEVMMATVAFRLFNRIRTGEAIFQQSSLEWDGSTAFDMYLRSGNSAYMRSSIIAYCGSGPYCTGAYIINSPNGMDKLTGVLTMIGWVYARRTEFLDEIRRVGTLEHAWEQFRKVDHIADFTSYEIVTDLRHTHLLRDAPDVDTWANPGPGAMRGLNRLQGRPLEKKQHKHAFVCEMRDILEQSRDPARWPRGWQLLEMRDVEHSLCEFDKYERARLGQGRPRGVFRNG